MALFCDCLAARKRKGWKFESLFLLLCLAYSCSCLAQESKQFLPEIDTYLTVNPLVRMMFQAKQTREGGNPTQAEIGPSVELYFKPWLKLRDTTAFDLDDAKKRALVFSAGYRYLPSGNAPPTNRMQLVVTQNFPVKYRILISDRNRADLDWQNGRFDWIYRNRLSLERSLAVFGYHPSLYLRSEEFYESEYGKWSTTALYAGSTFPTGRHLDISPYYEHQNNTGKKPNQQLNQFGLIASLYFSTNRK